MKKIITCTLALLLFSCAKEEKQDYTIVSGKMTNNIEDGKFNIIGNDFSHEIIVNQDGTFTDTLDINYNGAYFIRGTIGLTGIYLHKGKNVSFESNSQDLNDITFSGDLAIENNYLAQKSRLKKEILGGDFQTIYSIEEAEFLAKVEETDKKQKELLETTLFSVEDFKEKEINSLKYHKELILSRFASYHAHFAQKPDFEVSENFPKADETIDYDDASAFDFSGMYGPYAQLVSANFDKKVEEEYEKEVGKDTPFDELTYYKKSVEVFKTIKSQNIKNSLAQKVAYGINPANEMSEELYKELMANVTDENFKKELTEKFEKIKTLVKGNPSPKFDYENHKGGTTSLDDLKGKYVYIDVWATWCGPCKREIPYLKEVEREYQNQNIEFVGISIDRKQDYDTWREFVTTEELAGIQLYADNDWKSQFVTDYGIEGIPRFILVDPEGNIVSADAPRPSDSKLTELFDELGI